MINCYIIDIINLNVCVEKQLNMSLIGRPRLGEEVGPESTEEDFHREYHDP